MIKKYSEEDLSFLVESILDDLEEMLRITTFSDSQKQRLFMKLKALHEDRLEEMDR